LETLNIMIEIACFSYNRNYFYISNIIISHSKKQIV
jgi:hypothetical protein